MAVKYGIFPIEQLQAFMYVSKNIISLNLSKYVL